MGELGFGDCGGRVCVCPYRLRERRRTEECALSLVLLFHLTTCRLSTQEANLPTLVKSRNRDRRTGHRSLVLFRPRANQSECDHRITDYHLRIVYHSDQDARDKTGFFIMINNNFAIKIFHVLFSKELIDILQYDCKLLY
jgi:Tfp pilus assembly protein FimT